jgi:nucleotide-binding universal stress UspA family protein
LRGIKRSVRTRADTRCAMYQRILVPIDGSPTSDKGLDEAIALARLTGARLCLIHVLDNLSFATGYETCAVYTDTVLPFARHAGEKILQEGSARAAARGVQVETRLIDDLLPRMSELVVEQAKAWQADLIVIGTHGRRGAARVLLGSDAEQIMRMAPVPVLLVRAPAAAA